MQTIPRAGWKNCRIPQLVRTFLYFFFTFLNTAASETKRNDQRQPHHWAGRRVNCMVWPHHPTVARISRPHRPRQRANRWRGQLARCTSPLPTTSWMVHCPRWTITRDFKYSSTLSWCKKWRDQKRTRQVQFDPTSSKMTSTQTKTRNRTTQIWGNSLMQNTLEKTLSQVCG